MPAKSPRQQRAAGADVGRCRAGQAPQTFPTCKLAEEFAHKPAGGYGKLMDRSTKGSPPMSQRELRQGYRRL